MSFSAPSSASLPCAQQQRPSLLGALLRELSARTPMMGRLCPSRDHHAALVVSLPVLKLPETLLACVFSLGGLTTTLNASLSCRSAHAQLWQSPFFWRSLLQALGASDENLRALDRGRCPASAEALRDFARHCLLGIDLFAGNPAGDLILLRPGHVRTLDLEAARRAVLAMRPKDGTILIQRATDSVSGLLRSRAAGKAEVGKAEALLEAVSTRSDLFSTAQMLNVLGAHQKANEDCNCFAMMPKDHIRERRARRNRDGGILNGGIPNRHS